MKLKIEMLALLFLCGCSNLSPNEWQIKRTLSNLGCYQELINQIASDDKLREEILQIRASKKRGNFESITVKEQFRLIEMDEIKANLDSNWVTKCKDKIEEENDFRGIRVIDKNLIIIEIDKFNRYTLVEKTSKKRTVEFHRLVFAKKTFDKSEFYFRKEHQVWRDTIEENWLYEVTQMKI